MRLETILHHVEKHAGFVYEWARLVTEEPRTRVEIKVRARANSKAVCSGCGLICSGYDTLKERAFDYVPLWGIPVLFLYAMRRVNCTKCGVRVESVAWAVGKQRLTTSFAWYLAEWARRLSWSEVARTFHTSWKTVFRAVSMAVEWGRQRLDLSDLTAIGVDEVLWHRGHKYLTVVYEIARGRRRLLWIGCGREASTLCDFFHWLGPERSERLQFVCSDMWQPYLDVIAACATKVIHILDRFHIVARINKAIDEVRAAEAKELRSRGLQPVLTHSRWCLLKRPENLSEKQEIKLADLLRFNLRTVRCYLLKEDFQFLWSYISPFFAGRFLDGWCSRVMRSRIEPMKKVARSLREHRDLILNWFKARGEICAGAVEGLNNKLKVVTRRAYGYRTLRATEVALYHNLGALPVPKHAHKFV